MAKIVFQDEVGQNLNRYLITPTDGSAPFTADLARAADITKQGTPIYKETLDRLVQDEDLAAHASNTTLHVTQADHDKINGAVQGNTKAWVATESIIAGDAWGTRLIIPNFVFSEGCQVTFKAPQPPTDSNPVWANRIVIRRGSDEDDIGEYILSTLTKEPVSSDAWAVGAMVTVTLSSEVVGTWNGSPTAFFKGGAPSVPSIFGTGADGDAVISGTVTLPVTVPHQSIVEKQYKSLIINAGAILKCASWNAGLIIRVQGDCTIHGTIDQSGMAPKTNPQNNYPYPAQLVCGDGGNGGTGEDYYDEYSGGIGGVGMLKRPYGGGYSAGGAGGAGESRTGGNGGDSTDITIDVQDIFVGGILPFVDSSNINGAYGGGGPGGSTWIEGNGWARGGNGGSGPGGNGAMSSPNEKGEQYGGSGGGAGNYGGGVVLLYVGGNLLIDGRILCNGLSGGSAGDTVGTTKSGDGGAGGGAGGGAIYILHRGSYTNTGSLQVNGGAAGAAGTVGTAGTAGGIGSITVIQGDK